MEVVFLSSPSPAHTTRKYERLNQYLSNTDAVLSPTRVRRADGSRFALLL
jgi:hypothetical protein